MSIFLILLAAGDGKRLKSTIPKAYIKINNKTLLEHSINNFKKIQSYAIKTNNFVRLDMENSGITDLTLNIYKELIKINENSGIVIQAYLHRSENDIKSLPENINIRLCKGIYNEDKSIAIKDSDKINKNYIKLLSMIFEKNIYVKVRSTGKLLEAKIKFIADNEAEVNLSNAEYGISPGQACVFYLKDQVLGGGIIEKN